MTIPLVIFSDLDGTLLDHDTYSFAPAEEALTTLKKLGIPLILASSKTATEIMALRTELGFDHCPAIVENGCGILPGEKPLPGNENTPTYARIRAILEKLPPTLRQSYKGFGDWGVDGVIKHTGLGSSEAAKAADRQYSEPGLWLGDGEKLAAFLTNIEKHGLSARKGGRFLTLSFGGNKGRRMSEILALYSDRRHKPHAIALGDAPNDIEMLEAADIGVIIANNHGTEMPRLNGEKGNTIRRSTKPGPAGWNEMIMSILQEYGLIQA